MKDRSESENPPKSKSDCPTFKQNASRYFTEFADNTGIHGLKYVGEPNRLLVEKIWWLIFLAISLYICIYLIIETWVKWQTYPVLVSFARSPTPIWQIPFPAITICSETKTKQTVYNFTEAYHKVEDSANITDDDLDKFSKIALVCDRHLYHGGPNTTDLATLDFLKKIAPSFDEVFFECKWQGDVTDCKKLFTPLVTEEGNCFTFNMLDRLELFTNRVYIHDSDLSRGRSAEGWSLEGGYSQEVGKDAFPRRALSSGAAAGLFVTLKAYKQDLDYICKGPVQGFKVLMHNPAEIPRVSAQYFRAPLNQQVVVSLKPEMMTTSEGLREYKPHKRECFFPNERHLAFYKTYTQQNCQIECLTNYTLGQCGCVAYHMPHEEDTVLCGSGMIQCMYEARHGLLVKDVTKEIESSHAEADDSNQCDCLPACTSLTYGAENSQAQFDWRKYYESLKQSLDNETGIQLTGIGIFFRDMQFITSERNELYGSTDFLANTGGLLGLFTGFSFLSTVEIIYFLTLRLMCNIVKFGRKFWSGSKELIEEAEAKAAESDVTDDKVSPLAAKKI